MATNRHLELNEVEKAVTSLGHAYKATPGIGAFGASFAVALWQSGRTDEAKKVVDELVNAGFKLNSDYLCAYHNKYGGYEIIKVHFEADTRIDNL